MAKEFNLKAAASRRLRGGDTPSPPSPADLRSSHKEYVIGERRANAKARTYKDYYSSRGHKGDVEGDRR